jgi:hypothetical protein
MQMLGDIRQRHTQIARYLRGARPGMRPKICSDLVLGNSPHERPACWHSLTGECRPRRQQPPALSHQLPRPFKLTIKLRETRVQLRQYSTGTLSSPVLSISHQEASWKAWRNSIDA